MVDRCRNPSNQVFRYYGGRGIRVCIRWATSFTDFLADMGEPPAPRLDLDRIDNERGYCCGHPDCPECFLSGQARNCRWATHKENMRHTRRTRFLEHNGERLPLIEWTERLGVSPTLILDRIDKFGWTVADALTRPVRRRR
jgi:hypothetical protein